MRVGKLPVAAFFLLLLFGAKFMINRFFPQKSASIDPVLTGILEITVVVIVIYCVRLFIKWAYNYRKAA